MFINGVVEVFSGGGGGLMVLVFCGFSCVFGLVGSLELCDAVSGCLCVCLRGVG